MQLLPFWVHRLTCCSVCRKGLKPRQVLDIYSLKCTGKDRRLGASIARSYGVSPKTVRDIWNGMTWGELTSASHSGTIKSDLAYFLKSEFADRDVNKALQIRVACNLEAV